MKDLQTLPVLPLRDTVIFPGAAVPISVGRAGSLRAIERALETDQLVFAVAQRDGLGDASAENLFTFGTIARIEQVQQGPSGSRLLVHGQRRGVAIRFRSENGLLETQVRTLDEIPLAQTEDPTFVALFREVRERASELGQKLGMPAETVRQIVGEVADPGKFADLVASYVEAPHAERQELLETLSVEPRLRRVLVHVQRQLNLLEAQADIQSRVQQQIGEKQREAMLREQLRAIQKELGEGGDDTAIEELRQRLTELELPDAAREEVDRELDRLLRLSPESMEHQVVRTFLENVAELPWSERSEEHIDLAAAEKVLDEDHYGLADVKERVLEFLAVRKLQVDEARSVAQAEAAGEDDDELFEAVRPPMRGPILVFAGPPGVGKTSIAKGIARAMGREYVRIALGGARDQADISGHRRTYVGAMPGRIIQGMKEAGTKNPVFLLDEIDKLGISYQGDPASALLEVLDPAQNDAFTDHYLGVPFDLSEVLFIATANDLSRIPGPLLDRMEIVEFSGYTEAEKVGIAQRYLFERQIAESGLRADQVSITEGAFARLVQGYTREAGVRQLERELGRLVRKAARKVASGAAKSVTIDSDDVRELLGRPRVHPERAADRDLIGSATGMFYTPVGGDILFVEASEMPGTGKLVLTGQLGDVMRESALAAWSYARAHGRALHIDDGAFERDLHVHVPAGAIPKDGPSAGITMATAIVSELTGRAVRPDVAMTGEITLAGRVLPIGGVKEKVLGGVRAGIHEFILPEQNGADLEDLPQDVRDRITVHLVRELGQVLAITLRDARFEDGRLLFAGDDAAQIEPLSDWSLPAPGTTDRPSERRAS